MVSIKKGSKVVCTSCGSHIATVAEDILENERICENSFTEDGQGPWKGHERAACRECGKYWLSEFTSLMNIEDPDCVTK